jgi:hypothetical protein
MTASSAAAADLAERLAGVLASSVFMPSSPPFS